MDSSPYSSGKLWLLAMTYLCSIYFESVWHKEQFVPSWRYLKVIRRSRIDTCSTRADFKKSALVESTEIILGSEWGLTQQAITQIYAHVGKEQAPLARCIRTSQQLFSVVSPNDGVGLSTKDQTCICEKLIIFCLGCQLEQLISQRNSVVGHVVSGDDASSVTPDPWNIELYVSRALAICVFGLIQSIGIDANRYQCRDTADQGSPKTWGFSIVGLRWTQQPALWGGAA